VIELAERFHCYPGEVAEWDRYWVNLILMVDQARREAAEDRAAAEKKKAEKKAGRQSVN
jgi:hypothetical protein